MTQDQKSLQGRAWVDLLLLSMLWGGSFLAVEFALREVGVFTIVAHRVVWAALFLWAYVLWLGLEIPRKAGIWGAFLVMGLLNNVIPFSLLTWGQITIESGLASILNATTAIFGVVIAAIAFADERLSPLRALGVLLGFLGVTLVIGLENLGSLDIRSLAQLAALGASLSYAFASVWARKTLGSLPPEVAAAGMLTGSSLIILPAALFFEGMPSFDLMAPTLAALGYYSIGATVLAYLLYYRILATSGSGNLMLVTLLIPVIAVLLGGLVLEERLSAGAILGFLVIGFGMILLDGRLPRRLFGLFSN